MTAEGTMMLGEFGWFVAVFYLALALVFWHFRDGCRNCRLRMCEGGVSPPQHDPPMGGSEPISRKMTPPPLLSRRGYPHPLSEKSSGVSSGTFVT
jgi:hypothetical protein